MLIKAVDIFRQLEEWFANEYYTTNQGSNLNRAWKILLLIFCIGIITMPMYADAVLPVGFDTDSDARTITQISGCVAVNSIDLEFQYYSVNSLKNDRSHDPQPNYDSTLDPSCLLKQPMATVAQCAYNVFCSATKGGGRGGPYGHLDDHPSVNSGKKFTQSQKQKILAENEARNSGQLLDDVTGEPLVRPQQHKRGVTPPSNEAHVDHVYPRSKGGPNSFSNAEVRSRASNLQKGSKIE